MSRYHHVHNKVENIMSSCFTVSERVIAV